MQSAQLKKIILWTLVFLSASVFLCSTDYQSSSNDSKYYSELVVRYHDKDWREILSPKWGWNTWGFDKQSYMRDQLPGQVAMGVALAKIGVPAKHSLHIIEMGFLLGTFFLLVQIANIFVGSSEGSVLLYALMLTPLSFSYNIRANHEAGILFFSTLALFSGLKLSTRTIFSLTAILSCLALMWIKGPFLIFGFILTSWGFLLSKGDKKYLRGALTLAIAATILIGSGLIYEKLFAQWTGEPFFSEFYRIQIQERAMGMAKHPFLVQKYLNFQYYFLKYLGYALPWTLFAALALFKTNKQRLKTFLLSPLSLGLAGAAAAYIGAFSMSERTAGRYAFPGYYFFSAWLILFCFSQSEWFQRMHAKIENKNSNYLAALFWLVAFGIHFI